MTEQLTQDYMVYVHGPVFRVRGQVDGAQIGAYERADEAIQAAVDALAGTGGEVALHRGVYPLQDPIKLADNVLLRGRGRGSKLVVETPGQTGVGLLCEGLKGATVADLAIVAGDGKGARAGIVVDNCGDCKVRDVFCAGFADYGIWVRNNAFLCEIRGCSLAGNAKSNIFLDHLREGEYGNYVPTLVTNCIIYGGGKGIECKNAIVVNIVACAVYQTNDFAYHVHSTANSVVISGCRSFQISSHAVVVENAHEFNLSSNIFCWHTGHGIVIDDSYWGTICGNEVIDTGSYNPGGVNFRTTVDQLPEDVELFNGIHLLRTRGYNVTGNTIFNWSLAPKMRFGIKEDATSYNNTITGNNVNYYAEAMVLSEGRGSVTDNNVGYGEHPYNDEAGRGKQIQSFQRELTERFIQEQM